jgi:diguanylate cyclase (GGDEF)-like protein
LDFPALKVEFAVVSSIPAETEERAGAIDRVLPLRHWLGAEEGRNLEQAQARTRFMCTFVAWCGFGLASLFVDVPDAIFAIAVAYTLYAVVLAVDIHWRPAPSYWRRGSSVVLDNLIGSAIAFFGGGFAAYVGFNFLTTVGWGLRFGRHYLFLATAIALAAMAYNLGASPYWQQQLIFGGSIMFGMVATAANCAILLTRIKRGNERLAEKIDEVAQLASRDQLTRLPNRLHFHERLAQALAAAARSERQVAVLLFDIDGFKSVNDTLGHEAGDRLLQEVAQRVGRRLRQADTFARIGGDEFVVLMELQRDHLDAIIVAETVIKVIGEIDIFKHAGVRIGASCGIACFSPSSAQNLTPSEMLKLADRAMYEAKRAGKNGYRLAR